MAAILIVGDDAVLLETRARLLRDWPVLVTTSKHAAKAIGSNTYDLMIFCQTIPDDTAQTLIESARKLNPTVKTLAIHMSGEERGVDADLYEIQLQNPGLLVSVVARLLQSSSIRAVDKRAVKHA